MALGLAGQQGLLGGPDGKMQGQLAGLLSGLGGIQYGMPGMNMAQNLVAAEQAAPQAAPPAPAPAQASLPTAPASQAPEEASGGFQPGNMALMAGGMAAATSAAPRGSLGRALAEGIGAGTQAFVATKNAQQDAKDRKAAQAQYQSYVQSLPLDPRAKVGLIGMGVEAGSKMLAEAGLRVPEFTTQTATTADGQLQVIQTNKGTGETTVTGVGGVKPVEPENKPDSNVQAIMSVNHPGKNIADLSPAERAQVLMDAAGYRRSGAAQISQTAGTPGLKEANDVMWTQASGLLKSEYDLVKSIPERIKLYQSIRDMSTDDYFNGTAAQLRTRAASMASVLGLPVDRTKITNTQTMLAAINDAAIARIKELDGRPTDKDMEILQQAMGTQDYTPAALRNVMDRVIATTVARQQDFKSMVEAFEEDFAGTEYKIPRVYKSLPDVPRTMPDQVTYTDGRSYPVERLNGQTVIRVGDKIVPVNRRN